MAKKSDVPGSLRKRVFRESDYKCSKCGIRGFEKRFPRGGHGFYTHLNGVYLSIDHIVPKSKGGSSERKNLQVLCTNCNSLKGVGDA